MKSLASLCLCVASVSLVACRPTNDCGDIRMYDPENDLCVCRPEYTMVGDFCIPNDEVDAGTDAGRDANVDAPAVDGTVAMCTTPAECPDRANATPTCESMTCGFECDDDWGDCDGDATNGCETDLTSTAAHCGMCGNACAPLGCFNSVCADTIVEIQPGQYHTCARRSSGSVVCWGFNEAGALGNGTFDDSNTPVTVRTIDDALDLAVSGDNVLLRDVQSSCVVVRGGRVECWGSGFGPDDENIAEPVPVVGIGDAVRIEGGGGLGYLVLRSSGALVSLRGGVVAAVDVPAPVTDFAHAFEQACAISSGQVYCWGGNTFGQRGHGAVGGPIDFTPATVPGIDDAVAVRTTLSATCALRASGQVYCWGANAGGALGTSEPRPADSSDPAIRTTPEAVDGITSAEQLESRWGPSCALVAGEWRCWGLRFTDGEVRFTSEAIEVDVPAGAELALGVRMGCVSLGRVQCWGSNSYGQLGNGDNLDQPNLVEVVGLP